MAPGQALLGEGDHASIAFADGVDGLQLTTDNEVSGLRLTTSPDKRVIFNDTQVAGLGRMRLGIAAIGRVQILVREAVMRGHVDVEGLDILDADARARSERPHGFGVYVLQVAFTLWNMQPDERVVITAKLVGLSVGREGAPVRGSGIFVSGAGFTGGRLVAPLLDTGAVFVSSGRTMTHRRSSTHIAYTAIQHGERAWTGLPLKSLRGSSSCRTDTVSSNSSAQRFWR